MISDLKHVIFVVSTFDNFKKTGILAYFNFGGFSI